MEKVKCLLHNFLAKMLANFLCACYNAPNRCCKKSVSPLLEQRGHKINSILFCTLDKSDQVLAKTAYQRTIWFVKLFVEFVCDHNSKSRNYFARDAPKAPSNMEKDAFAIFFAPKADFGRSVLP